MQNHLRLLLATGALTAFSAAFDWRVAPLVLVVSLIVMWPLSRRKRIWFVGDVEGEFKIVSRRREEALRALKDLEEDKLAGKLPPDEYNRLRPKYLETAKELTAQLDKIQERRAVARRRIEQDLDRSKSQA